MALRIFSLILIVSFNAAAFAQSKPLTIEGISPNVYLIHTVAPKENYYSIGRMYNISPKDQIAPYNSLQMEKGLSPGQTIKIPLIATNFVQNNDAASDEVLVPVYHTLAEKEGLYRVSVNYNKVPIETLKQWNKIKGDAVGNGTKLIVGYLKVKKDLSPLAGASVMVPVVETAVKEVKPPVIKPVTEPVKPPVKEPVVQKTPEKEKPVVIEPEKKVPVKIEEPRNTEVGKFNGGIFKSVYDNQAGADLQKETGAANVFKSTSGWSDGKYYCLHNSAQPGTVIKITSNTTGKSIYAKVLDIMPDIKQNSGILIRISNAAAEDLGVGENKFDCALSYSK